MKNSLFKYSSYILAFAGIVFSALNIFQVEELLCVTSSCEVFSEFAVFGISLWIYSAAFFALLFGLLCINKWALTSLLCLLGIACDAILLCLMLITSPCFSCLIIALILALLTLCVYKTHFENNYVFIALLLWFLLFLVNAGALVKTSVSPYVIYMNEARKENVLEASMRVYFSPSCSACNDLVQLLGEREQTNANDIIWLPVAEEAEDIAKVLQMQEYINNGDSLKVALEKVKAEPQKSSVNTLFPDFVMQIQLLINQSRLNAAGTSKIPFIEYTGVPAFLNKPASTKTLEVEKANPLEALGNMSKEQNPEKNTVDEILNFGVEAYCDEKNNTEPCE